MDPLNVFDEVSKGVFTQLNIPFKRCLCSRFKHEFDHVNTSSTMLIGSANIERQLVRSLNCQIVFETGGQIKFEAKLKGKHTFTFYTFVLVLSCFGQ